MASNISQRRKKNPTKYQTTISKKSPFQDSLLQKHLWAKEHFQGFVFVFKSKYCKAQGAGGSSELQTLQRAEPPAQAGSQIIHQEPNKASHSDSVISAEQS